MQTEASSTVLQPEQRTDEQVADDLDWLRSLREQTRQRWGGIYGGHDAHLDTLGTGPEHREGVA